MTVDRAALSELLLPRVMHLSLHSIDRQTKVLSSELLHALTVYTIGWSAQQHETTQQKNPVSKLYKKLFPAILRLACDVEQVIS